MKAKLAHQNKEMGAMLVHQINVLGMEVNFWCAYYLLIFGQKKNIVCDGNSDKALLRA